MKATDIDTYRGRIKTPKHGRRWIKLTLLQMLLLAFYPLTALWLTAPGRTVGAASGEIPALQAHRAQYLSQCQGTSQQDHHCIWAWLETRSNPAGVSASIDYMLSVTEYGGESFPWYLNGTGWTVPQVINILIRYGDRVNSADRHKILTAFRNDHQSMWAANPNYQTQHMVGLYLYTKFFEPELSIRYDFWPDYPHLWPDFSCNGRSYERGGTYNLHQLTYDWLQWRMNDLAQMPRRDKYLSEMDSDTYSWSFFNGYMMLHDGTDDPEMRRRAKMTLDILLLDAALDTLISPAGAQWGGAHSRHYPCRQVSGSSFFYWKVYWETNDNPVFSWPMVMPAYVSDYVPPGAVYDLTVTNDEPEAYYHLHKENNPRNHEPGFGKWNMVTKYWSLGGNGSEWELNISSEEGVPFKIWINDQKELYTACDENGLAPFGKDGNQYLNAAFIGLSPAYVHLVTGGHTFDEASEEGGWKFYREGKTAVGIHQGSTGTGLQVVTLGVDVPPYAYGSYEAFKVAIKANGGVGYNSFRNSQGDTIRKEWDPEAGRFITKLNGEPVWDFPFDRMETIDQAGEKLIDWNGGVMTLSRHGGTCAYDYNTWTYTGNACGPAEDQPTPIFRDVPVNHWAQDYIELLYREGYVAGCSAEPPLFCPEATMTRAESAVFVERGIHGAGYLPPEPAEQIFADVLLREWFAKWATGLWEDGYTTGCGADPLIFCPSKGHTRAEAAVFFLRLMMGRDYVPPDPAEVIYEDVPVGADAPWYSRWVIAAHEAGLTEGCEDEENRGDALFRPLEGLARSEAACMMARAKGLMSP